MKLSHMVASFAVCAILISLFLGFKVAFNDSWDVTETDTENGKSIMESLDDIYLIKSINQTATAFYDIQNPSKNVLDLGALSLAGIGIVKTIIGIIGLPTSIIYVVLDYYSIPGIIITGIMVLSAVFIGFVMLSVYLGRDL